MRKVSKNRTDDDIISSTNGSGSVHNEEKQNSEQSVGDNEKESVSGKDDKSANEAESDVEKKSDSSKKRKSKKTKSKKNKATKTKKGEEDEEEYEVEEVIDSKRIRGKLYYLIRWKGYSADNDTWEPEKTLSCPELINKFNEEKENSKDEATKSSRGKKGLKRKSNTKTKMSPKKTKNQESDSEEADEEAEYEVDRILEVHHKKSGERDFLIHWKGWASKFDSWEPESNLNCPELIKKFMAKVDKARSSESRSLRVAPESTNRFTLQAPSSGRRLSKRKNQRQRVRYDNAE
ncbi:PREDICTED: chromobox protein homolog 5-like [Papilio xuthus]|uniref:Chromobox protein homolog 5-like n=2 Tax=Papilio xuthus TaxID=66420 RepID=A0A194PX69_PAPXU|nr:PREDICTED: chromobox protein homolog 5-like [Papilio xuthus]KPI97359.1 Chromobox protein-like 5 [Papilio xuthus]